MFIFFYMPTELDQPDVTPASNLEKVGARPVKKNPYLIPPPSSSQIETHSLICISSIIVSITNHIVLIQINTQQIK